MPERFEDQAIVLRSLASGEADRRLTCLGRGRGIFSALAKGARKSRKRFMGKLEPFQRGALLVSRYQGTDYVDDFRPAGRTDRIPTELGRYYLACYACELCLLHLPQGHPAPEVYDLLAELLDRLQDAPTPDLVLHRAAFEARYLDLHGLYPQPTPCAACGSPLPAEMAFDPVRPEWRCGKPCTPGRHPSPVSGLPLSRGAFQLLERIRSQPLEALARLAASTEQRAEVGRFATTVLAHQVPLTLKSRALLDAELRPRA